MNKKSKTIKKLFFGTDQCVILEQAAENFMGTNYSIWGTPSFRLYDDPDDALLDAVFDFTNRGEFILQGEDCWNFDRALYEALWAGDQLSALSEHDESFHYQEVKKIWRANKIALAKNLLADDVERQGETNKKHLLEFIWNTLHDLHDKNIESYEPFSSTEHHDPCNALWHLQYMLENGETPAAAQEYLKAEEAEHEFRIEDHLYHAPEIPRDKPWSKKFIKTVLMPALHDFENRCDQSHVIQNVIERLMALHTALETDRQKVLWDYKKLQGEDFDRTHGFNPRVHEITLTLKNPLVVDVRKEIVAGTKDYGKTKRYKAVISLAKKEGHDGVILNNSTRTGKARTEYIVFGYEKLGLNSQNRKIPVPAREK